MCGGAGRISCISANGIGFSVPASLPGPTVLGSHFQKDLTLRTESGWGFVCLALRAGGGREMRYRELEWV